MKSKKTRLDCLLTERKFAESRNAAKALIMSGIVFVNGERIEKAGTLIDAESEIIIKGNPCPYVSRGGLKLEGVIEELKIDVKDKTAVDIGASTGGFTDCLLQKGAKTVYAVDTGHGQLHWKLRNESRVINLEKVNARYIESHIIPVKTDLITIDVSFISIKKIIPQALKLLKDDGIIISLIKPQFEIGKGMVDKGGIIKSTEKHRIVLEDIISFLSNYDVDLIALTTSKINGRQGNKEFFVLLKNGKRKVQKDFSHIIDRTIKKTAKDEKRKK